MSLSGRGRARKAREVVEGTEVADQLVARPDPQQGERLHLRVEADATERGAQAAEESKADEVRHEGILGASIEAIARPHLEEGEEPERVHTRCGGALVAKLGVGLATHLQEGLRAPPRPLQGLTSHRHLRVGGAGLAHERQHRQCAREHGPSGEAAVEGGSGRHLQSVHQRHVDSKHFARGHVVAMRAAPRRARPMCVPVSNVRSPRR